jgi:hypothetical protein
VISPRARFWAALAGVGLLGTLVLAAQLQPDPRGWGTHEQLGLPPCTLLLVAGMRCPACGMTTSWAYAARGQLDDALRTHAGGTLLAIAALLTAVFALAAAALGRWPLWQPSEMAILCLVTIAAALVGGEWLVRLWTG